ncbi:MAG TPA: hypothetical protein VN711_02320 [Candidatus Saccharimonadales bacterium]|nr:hypothetical protein [Candidatus Saccharimonadales bacterium]
MPQRSETVKIVRKNKDVVLTGREYGKQQTDRATVFLAGWAMRGDSGAFRRIGQEIRAMRPDDRVFTLATRSGRKGRFADKTHSLTEFLAEEGVREVTLMGYSEGATKAISAAMEIQNAGMVIDGIVLSSPLGLHDRKFLTPSLLGAMFFAIPVDTVGHILKHPKDWRAFFSALVAGLAVFRGVGEEVLDQKRKYIPQLRRDVREMSQKNPERDALDVLVVVIAGEKDTVARRNSLQKSVDEMRENGAPIKMLTAEKLSSHGLPFLRPRTFVRSALGSLDRMKREKGK